MYEAINNNTILGITVNREYFISALLNTVTCTISQGTIFHITYITAYRKPFMIPENIRTIILTIMLLASFNNTIILLLQACYFLSYFTGDAMSIKLSSFFQASSNFTYYLIFTAPLFITIWRYYNILMIKKLSTKKAFLLYFLITIPGLIVYFDNIFISKKLNISEAFTIKIDISLKISKWIQTYYNTVTIILLIIFSILLIYTLKKINQTLKTTISHEVCRNEIWITIAYLYHTIIPYLHQISGNIFIYFIEIEKIEVDKYIWIIHDIFIGIFSILLPYTFVLFLKPYREMIFRKFHLYQESNTMSSYEVHL
uniref:G_PROTEIN_RECEP_F1_2 domain-containing protein n=1 Tax=Parastrongyloides trichosuri TaxID=131310 RepID=A0A0N4Z9S6_PARTI